MKDKKSSNWVVLGCWQKNTLTNNRPISLFVSVFKESPSNLEGYSRLLGVAGGHCGAGLFELEQFAATLYKTRTKSLWMGSEDKIKGTEIDFSRLSRRELDTCNEALQELWEWNSENNWIEAQQLRLYPYNEKGLQVVTVKDYQAPLLIKGSLAKYSHLITSLSQSLHLELSPHNILQQATKLVNHPSNKHIHPKTDLHQNL